MRIQRRPVPAIPSGLVVGHHPVLARLLAARGIRDARELDHSLDRLHPHHDLAGIDTAVDLLVEAIEGSRRILVVGDYDADGATASAVTVLGLRRLGAGEVGFLVPDRFRYGYGLTPEIVAVAAGREPHLLITVDNGVSSHEGVAAARAAGIRVLVTDHHLPGDSLPAADALVNPNLPGDRFPSKHLAGVGVAFYLLVALRARLRSEGRFSVAKGQPGLADLLDLVALGTVADVVSLDHNNRILVAQGLARIRAGRCRPGISALLEVARRRPEAIVASDLGFAVAPRLNAAGRLADMSLGIECLLTDSPDRARRIATELDRLNRERRAIEAGMREQAEAQLQRLALGDARRLPAGLCLHDPAWHQGVIGILASRVREQIHRPVVAFADAGEGRLKGSARSITGFHVRDALEAVATRHPGLVEGFGGHAMAAGLSLLGSNLEAFRGAFEEEAARRLGEAEPAGTLWSDGPLVAGELNLRLARELRAAGPWGAGFPEPLFDGEFRVFDRRVVGEAHLRLRLEPAGGGAPVEAIAFNAAGLGDPANTPRLHAAYRLGVNEWQGRESLQLVVEHLEPTRG